MKKVIITIAFFTVGFLTLQSCSDGLDASLLINEWEVTGLYFNNAPVPVTSTNIYSFSESGQVIYSDIITDPPLIQSDTGSWIFDNEQKSLSLLFPQGLEIYTVKKLMSAQMTWEIDGNGGTAKIELTAL